LDAYDALPVPGAKIEPLFAARRELAWGAYFELTLHPAQNLEIVPGLRTDMVSSSGYAVLGVDPRLSGRFQITDRLRIVHAYGIAHQPPSYLVPFPGLQIANLHAGLQWSFQTSAGIEVDFPEDVTATVTGFHNAFFNMNDSLATVRPIHWDPRSLTTRSRGSSLGVELLLRRQLTHRLGGFLSYTLSRSVRNVEGDVFPSTLDRTHVVNVALSHDLGARWRAGARLAFYTGIPKYDYNTLLGGQHPERTPPFHRLDVRLEKRWGLGERGFISLVLEGFNVTLQKEVSTISCSELACSYQKAGPITIPSIGVEAGW
jgi:hypothetical protein